MSNRTLTLDDRLYDYLLNVSVREHPLLEQLRAETAVHPGAIMQIAPEQGQFMAWLVALMGARRAIEVGTFTGYSALAVGLALPEEGELIACDINPETGAIARRYWQQAGLEDKITLHLAPALETLDRLLAEGRGAQFDFAFIDADKGNYGHYFERCLELVRVGGVIAIDNVLWSGRVADRTVTDENTAAIRAFNARLAEDGRVAVSLVPIADGLTLCPEALGGTVASNIAKPHRSDIILAGTVE